MFTNVDSHIATDQSLEINTEAFFRFLFPNTFDHQSLIVSSYINRFWASGQIKQRCSRWLKGGVKVSINSDY